MSNINSKINKVLVLGASGFIGGRLVERLFLKHNHMPKCLVRDYGKLSRIARFPIEIIHGDVLQPVNFQDLISDCDVYVFSVHGKDKNRAISWNVNTKGLSNMLQLAVKYKIKNFIFLSTTAIYEEQYDNCEINENINPVCKKKDYAGSKLKGERLCLEYSKKHGLPVTILRPTIVYGPFAPSFTIYPAELVRSGALKDYGSFSGLCNPVYVDDVVDIIIESIMNENAINDTFNVSSGETIQWKYFFDVFSEAISGKKMEKSSYFRYLSKSIPLFILKKSLKMVVQLAPDFAKGVYGFIKSKGSGNWSWVKGQDVSSINLKGFRRELIVNIDKLRTKLGYTPKYTFDEGFKITRDWLLHQNYMKNEGKNKR